MKDRYVFFVNDIQMLIFLDSSKIAIEAQHGLIAQVIKDVIFSKRPGHTAALTVAETTDMAIG
jgi:COP9 signalosome complex subunit 5